jgi:formylmethanofuran dehydrogenase subunit E-like metal-binding protein
MGESACSADVVHIAEYQMKVQGSERTGSKSYTLMTTSVFCRDSVVLCLLRFGPFAEAILQA